MKTPKQPYIPAPRWNDYFDFPTKGSLRWMLFNSKQNGLEQHLRRVGNRILIHVDGFWEWVDQQKAS